MTTTVPATKEELREIICEAVHTEVQSIALSQAAIDRDRYRRALQAFINIEGILTGPNAPAARDAARDAIKLAKNTLGVQA